MTQVLEAPPTTTPAKRPGVSPWWRAAAIFFLLILSIGLTAGWSMYEVFKTQISYLQSKLQTVPQVRYVAVLLDDRQAPAMLVTYDPQDAAFQLQRLNGVSEGREDTMQLWGLPPDGKPQSLGILESKGRTLRLPSNEKLFSHVAQLAISVEDKGGVPNGKGPRLPYLFTGALIQKAL